MIESGHERLSIASQCNLLGVPRSTYYHQAIPESDFNLLLMREIDILYLDTPSYGSRLMTAALKNAGYKVNRKRIARLMKEMCIEAIYPKPKIRTTHPGGRRFPYLLKELEIDTIDKVWGTDITYIPVNGGYAYLVAFIDLHSRYVLSWKFSNSLESDFCIEALEAALKIGSPKIINSDQGVQYGSHAYVDMVQGSGALISMSGRGKCWDNIFVERFWRTLKYEEVFLKQYENLAEAQESIESFIQKYNKIRPHSSLNYTPPATVYFGG